MRTQNFLYHFYANIIDFWNFTNNIVEAQLTKMNFPWKITKPAALFYYEVLSWVWNANRRELWSFFSTFNSWCNRNVIWNTYEEKFSFIPWRILKELDENVFHIFDVFPVYVIYMPSSMFEHDFNRIFPLLTTTKQTAKRERNLNGKGKFKQMKFKRFTEEKKKSRNRHRRNWIYREQKSEPKILVEITLNFGMKSFFIKPKQFFPYSPTTSTTTTFLCSHSGN
jgi:hypothetical protein